MKERLSSDNLYHFTKNAETVSKIIETGFRFSFCNESVPNESYTRNLFNVSFCDIKFEESENHRKCYGNNAIVLSKDWGINKGASPVRYIHSNSPGLSEPYKLSRKNYHLLRGLSLNIPLLNKLSLSHYLSGNQPSFEQSDFEFALLYLNTSLMEDDTKDELFDIKKELSENLDSFKTKYNELDKKFINLYNDLSARKKEDALLLVKYIHSLIKRINDLHNEFIKRDNYTRIYEENFQCPLQDRKVKRILYDEREWRAISILEIGENDTTEHLSNVSSYMEEGFLPSTYNLSFIESDIVAILAEDEIAKQKILQSKEIETGLLSKEFIEKNIYTLEEFREK